MINFEVNQQAGKKVSSAQWKKWFTAISKTLKIKGTKDVSVAIVGDAEMKKMNKYFRGQNKVTDVLSFGEADAKIKDMSKKYLGEIVICYPQAVKQAKKLKHSTEKEIEVLLVHGFLHLLGYDHHASRDEKEMKVLESRILGNRGLI